MDLDIKLDTMREQRRVKEVKTVEPDIREILGCVGLQ